MTTDQTFDPAKIIENPQGRLADLHGLDLSFSGTAGNAGAGGTVTVAVYGSVTTSGRTAHALVAQSIGGGGGAAFGGQLNARESEAGGAVGHGGTVDVKLGSGSVISTSGDGAYGILAQSIGGGGGLAGDLANASDFTTHLSSNGPVQTGNGNADNVTIGLSGASISTSGHFAPAIYAQSVGGGGGLFVMDGAIHSGTAGGEGTSGDLVSVSLVATKVSATGYRSPGIMVQSAGALVGKSEISIDATSSVTGGLDNVAGAGGTPSEMAAAIYVLGGSDSIITNAGLIAGIDGAGPATAINAMNSAHSTITNSGKIIGNIFLAANGGVFTNLAGGIVETRGRISLGANGVLNNFGTLEVGAAQLSGTTTLQGDLLQGATGRLVFDVDFAGTTSDMLSIEGRADVAGSVVVQPTRITNRAVTILTATEGVTLAFTAEGISRLAEIACAVNESTENIGARRLSTVMERLLDEVSFDATRLEGQTVTIDAPFVDERLAALSRDEDLSRYIL